MKIIIDISEKQYEIIKEIVKNQNSVYPEADSAEKIILNGVPLSKDKEDLISKSVFDKIRWIRWERDITIEQLEDLYYELGKKPR